MMPTVIEINDLAGLTRYRGAWHDLLAQTPRASFLLSPEWLEAHWNRVGASRRLRVLFVLDGDAPVGIVPLNVQTEPTSVGPIRVLTYPIDGWISFCRPVGPRPAEALRAAIEHLRRTPRDWDVLDLRWIPGDDPQETAARSAVAATRLNATFQPWERIGLVELDGSWEDYWQRLKKRQHNRHRNVLRLERRLAERGEITHVRCRPRGAQSADADPRWDLYEACEQLADQSWQAGLEDGNTLSHDSMRDFFRIAHRVAVDAGALDLNLLLLDGRPVAFAYGYHHNGSIDVLRIGYDPSLASVGPGNVLWMHLIRDSFERGDRVLDLGPETFHYQAGHESLGYKQFWCTRIQPSYRCLHYAVALRAQSLRFARWIRHRMQSRIQSAVRPAAASTSAAVTRHEALVGTVEH